MCDVHALIAEMKTKKLQCSPVDEQRWGSITRLALPGGGTLGVYQPKHPSPARGQAVNSSYFNSTTIARTECVVARTDRARPPGRNTTWPAANEDTSDGPSGTSSVSSPPSTNITTTFLE